MTEIIPFKKSISYVAAEESAGAILQKNLRYILAFVIVGLGVHLLFFGDYYFTFDDAYVFHVYARNLADGNGFSFNPGEVSHAATPLLTFLLAAQHSLFGDGALVSGKIVNLLFSLGASLLLFLIAYRISSSRFIAFAATIVWAASPLESILSAGPQDFTLFTFLLLLSLYLYLYHPQSLWTYLVLSLAVLTRYEGALFAGFMFLNHLYLDWRNGELQWRNVILRILLLSFLPLIWFTYIGTHSTLIPSSGSAKLNPWAIRKIPHAIAGIAIFFLLPLILSGIVAAFVLVKEKFPRLVFLFVWVAFCLFFYGPFLDNRRYYIHLLPFLALFSLLALWGASEKYFRSEKLSQIFLFGTLSLCFFAYFSSIGYYYIQTHEQDKHHAYAAYKDGGLWLKQNTPESARFASEEIGVIPYFAERNLVDFSGWLDLNSKQFREKADGINPRMLAYLATKKPDYLVVNTDLISAPREQVLTQDSRLKLVHSVPLLQHEHLLIYSCKW
jgi:arabinofuranosyltransferase